MFLGAEVSAPQPLHVGFVEGLELQEMAPCLLEWQLV
jgi:hypothetical protein